jgi:hypothetical protein
MKEERSYQEDIESIRKLMERSVKFISLSGLSGIASGAYALIGAGIAAYVLNYPLSRSGFVEAERADNSLALKVALIAGGVLAASLVTGYWLSARKSKRLGAKIWDASAKRLFINLAVPLVTGGIFIGLLWTRGHVEMIAPVSLIFYGLALINASPNVYEEVRYVGYSEILIGLIAAAWPGYGLLFWAIGFGVVHILYGAVMYKKYDS